MDRASDSGSEGWGFESLPVYQKSRHPFGCLLFCCPEVDSKDSIAICRWHIAATSSKTGCYHNFCPSHARAKMQTSPFRCTKYRRGYPPGILFFILPSGREGLEPSKCNSPVDCCRRRLDGGEPLSAQSADENESLPV